MRTCDVCGYKISANAKKCVCGNVLVGGKMKKEQLVLLFIPLVALVVGILMMTFGVIYQNYTLLGFGVVVLTYSFVILLKFKTNY